MQAPPEPEEDGLDDEQREADGGNGWPQHEGFHKWGYPNNGWFISGRSHLEMDDNWGYPYFRKPANK